MVAAASNLQLLIQVGFEPRNTPLDELSGRRALIRWSKLLSEFLRQPPHRNRRRFVASFAERYSTKKTCIGEPRLAASSRCRWLLAVFSVFERRNFHKRKRVPCVRSSEFNQAVERFVRMDNGAVT